MTHKFFANVIETLGADLVEARVEALKEDTFYGVAKLRKGDGAQEIDARPSDILALAAQTGCPFYVGEEVMERARIDIERKDEMVSQLGAGVDVLIDEVNETWRRVQSEMDEAARERCHQELIE